MTVEDDAGISKMLGSIKSLTRTMNNMEAKGNVPLKPLDLGIPDPVGKIGAAVIAWSWEFDPEDDPESRVISYGDKMYTVTALEVRRKHGHVKEVVDGYRDLLVFSGKRRKVNGEWGAVGKTDIAIPLDHPDMPDWVQAYINAVPVPGLELWY